MTTLSDKELAAKVRRELLEDILPFWRTRTLDQRRGGFIGGMSNDLRVQDDASKGLILNARILWTFSAAWRYTQDEQDRVLARRSYDYLMQHFLDEQCGGFFWELDATGNVLEDHKKVYGEAFCVYALVEYYRSFEEPQSLERAVEVFRLIETHARDRRYGGYFEVISPDWRTRVDVPLSDKDMNEKKSMNNHLHILEAYTNLLRVWREPPLADRLRELIELFQHRILNSDQTHLQHFFDEAWTAKSDSYTFGHDIEASWLLHEAAEVLGDEPLLAQARDASIAIARAVLAEGVDANGGLFYEGRAGRIVNSNKEWWPQAEAVVGFYNAWQLTGEPAFREAAVQCWQFIEDRVVDRVNGEWFWCIRPDGRPDPTQPKVSIWKAPYHNSRCCLEIVRRTQSQRISED
jgi:mannobiose 2-epimerase